MALVKFVGWLGTVLFGFFLGVASLFVGEVVMEYYNPGFFETMADSVKLGAGEVDVCPKKKKGLFS